jgi:hypothetical protein
MNLFTIIAEAKKASTVVKVNPELKRTHLQSKGISSSPSDIITENQRAKSRCERNCWQVHWF